MIKALHKVHRGEKGQKGELITHNVEVEELSPDAAWNTHILSQHCLENQVPFVSAELSAVKVNKLLIYYADGFLTEEEKVNVYKKKVTSFLNYEISNVV